MFHAQDSSSHYLCSSSNVLLDTSNPMFGAVSHLCPHSHTSSSCLPPQEYKRKQIEEQRQAERLQRQLQQERAYLVSLQQQQQQQQQQEGRQAEKKQLYHYKDMINPNDKPAWAKEVSHSMHDVQRHACNYKYK